MRYLYLLASIATVGLTVGRAADVAVMEELVAKVNGDIITSGELADDRIAVEADLRKQGVAGPALEAAIKEQLANVVRQRIDNLLLTQRAKDLNIKVDQDVNREIANYMRRTNTPDPEEFQKLVVKETGKPYEDFRANLQDQIMMQTVIREEIMRKISLTADETHTYYDAHKNDFQREERVFLREIVVATDTKKTPEELAAAETKAKNLATRGQRGETFSTMAQNNSDAITKEQGGLLEPFAKGALSPELEAQVWDKPAGTVTDAIKLPSNSGWIILKVEDHQRSGLAAYSEVEGEIQNRLYAEREQPALRAYLTKLRQDAFLQIKPSYVDSGAAPTKDTRWGDVATLKPETITRAEVISNPSMKRLLGLFPVPGTEKTGASSSR